jgi:hypothetical protein
VAQIILGTHLEFGKAVYYNIRYPEEGGVVMEVCRTGCKVEFDRDEVSENKVLGTYRVWRVSKCVRCGAEHHELIRYKNYSGD